MAFLTFETDYVVELEVITCGSCNILHAVPKQKLDRCRKDRSHGWHCPNGCKLHFVTTEADRLRKELEKTKKDLETAANNNIYYTNRVEELHGEKRAVEIQLKGTKTKLRNSKTRHAAGVCPCCQRTFKQLVQHMANKHPDYKTEE